MVTIEVANHGLKVEKQDLPKDEKAEFAVFDLSTWKGGAVSLSGEKLRESWHERGCAEFV